MFVAPSENVFGSICEELTHVNSPYDFDKIPIHILGSIYERFLGKVINAKAKSVSIDEKPEVRKAGGVYYTPQYIVKYIIDNTVGKLIEGKTPKEIQKLRFADIACGSGSFLITVFDTLLHYHSKWYNEHPKEAKENGCINNDGVWVLSLEQKRKILTNNIYGVDIDAQAVEVTQLSLFLKLLEEETTTTIHMPDMFIKDRILPDLSKNIKCGNSLIGTDILNNNLFGGEIDEEKIKPMDFESQFPDVFILLKKEKRGFDAIVGNPPYVRQETIKKDKDYFNKSYHEVYDGTADLYIYFIYKSILSLKEDGFFGYIVSNKFVKSNYGKGLRSFLSKNVSIINFIDFFEKRVFGNVGVDPCIIIAKKKKPDDSNVITYNYTNRVVQKYLKDVSWTFGNQIILALKQKIEDNGNKIITYKSVKINFGIKSGLSDAFIINKEEAETLIGKSERNADILRPLLRGRDLKRYSITWTGLYLIDARIGVDLTKYKAVFNHVEKYKHLLYKRTDYKKGIMEWYNLRPCTYYEDIEKPKIIYPDISDTGGFYWDTENYFFNNTVYMISNSPKYWTAILNSKLILWYYKQIASSLGKKGIRYFKQFVELIPIIELSNEKENYLDNLLDQMLEAKKKLNLITTESQKNYYEDKCNALDRQIDLLVYELYGLTEEEIKIVES